VDPPVAELEGKQVRDVRRMGKRIVIGFECELFAVLHLMIAGRLRWREPGVPIPRKLGLAALDFPNGSVLLTEAGTKKRASLYLTRGEAALKEFDRGGVEPLDASPAEFRSALLTENHTLKRALTDPRLFSGIGNAYSDEILHRARLSPVRRTLDLQDSEIEELRRACIETLKEWIIRLRADATQGLPEKVTAFREGMAVHGRYQQPCRICGTPVQRIRYADNEVNYCPGCQTGGRLLRDRSLSRLLKDDWPKSIEELDERLGRR
jgi:formamidopyrimidine-DNA glycosylase